MDQSTKDKLVGGVLLFGGSAALLHSIFASAQDAVDDANRLRLSLDAANITAADATQKVVRERSIQAAGGALAVMTGIMKLRGLEIAKVDGSTSGLALSGLALSGDMGALALSGELGDDEDEGEGVDSEESEMEEQMDRVKAAIKKTPGRFHKIYWNWMDRAKKDGEAYAKKLSLKDPDFDPEAYWKEMGPVVKVVAIERLAVYLTAQGVNPVGKDGKEIADYLKAAGRQRFVVAYWNERISRLRKAKNNKMKDRIKFAKQRRNSNLKGWGKVTDDLVRVLKKAK